MTAVESSDSIVLTLTVWKSPVVAVNTFTPDVMSCDASNTSALLAAPVPSVMPSNFSITCY